MKTMAISKTYIVLLAISNSCNENIITKKSRLGDSPMSSSYTLFVNIQIFVLCLFKCSKDYIVRFLTNSSPKPNYCIAYYLYGFPISLALRLKNNNSVNITFHFISVPRTKYSV